MIIEFSEPVLFNNMLVAAWSYQLRCTRIADEVLEVDGPSVYSFKVYAESLGCICTD